MAIERIVVLVADTVRSDYLGYNGGHVNTPNIDRLAERSTIFRRHYASSFPTVPARYDYLTGKPAWIDVGWGPLPRQEYSVVGSIASAGYKTLGVVDTPFYQASGFHYDRGFHYFYDMRCQPLGTPEYSAFRAPDERDLRRSAGTMPQWPITGKLIPEPRLRERDHAAPRTMAQAESCLEYLYEDKFFALIDTWDPHEPWDAPSYYVRHYSRDFTGARLHPPYGKYRDVGMSDEDVELARALYSGKLEMVDRWIGVVLDKLDYLGIADSTAVIFTSDHGFYFGEHGYLGKMCRRGPGEATWLRSPLYEELIHVPLLFSVPGEKPRTVDELTCALDLGPTLLDLAGLTPPEWMPGQSLLPAATGGHFEGHELVVSATPLANPGEELQVVDDLMRTVAEWQPVTVTSKDWALLYSIESEPIELYQLDRDPHQETNVAQGNEEEVARLIQSYRSLLQEYGAKDEHITPRLADK